MTARKKILVCLGWYGLGMFLGMLLFFLLSEYQEGIREYLLSIADRMEDLEVRYTLLGLLSFQKYSEAFLLLILFGYLPFRRFWYFGYLMLHGIRHGLLCLGFLTLYRAAGCLMYGSIFLPQALVFVPICFSLIQKGIFRHEILSKRHSDRTSLFFYGLLFLGLFLCVFLETFVNPLVVKQVFTEFPQL